MLSCETIITMYFRSDLHRTKKRRAIIQNSSDSSAHKVYIVNIYIYTCMCVYCFTILYAQLHTCETRLISMIADAPRYFGKGSSGAVSCNDTFSFHHTIELL